MNKKIWILWFQGFDKAPHIVIQCLRSWKKENDKDWEIIELSESNIGRYISNEKVMNYCYNKSITKAAMSDIIRIELLKTHGGLWVDATTFCNKSLNSWLSEYIQTGFFAFSMNDGGRIISSWFLYADEYNYIIEKWHQAAIHYVEQQDIIGTHDVHLSHDKWKEQVDHVHYFWFHYLFTDLYEQNMKVKQQWDTSPKIDASGPHLLLNQGMTSPISEDTKKLIDSREHPLFKLSYRYERTDTNDSVLHYLIGS